MSSLAAHSQLMVGVCSVSMVGYSTPHSTHTHTACAISSPPHPPTPPHLSPPILYMHVLCTTLPHDPHNHVTLSMPLPPTHSACYLRTYIYLVYLLPIKHYYPFAYHHPHHHPTARTTPAYLHISLTHTPAYDPHPHMYLHTELLMLKVHLFKVMNPFPTAPPSPLPRPSHCPFCRYPVRVLRRGGRPHGGLPAEAVPQGAPGAPH